MNILLVDGNNLVYAACFAMINYKDDPLTLEKMVMYYVIHKLYNAASFSKSNNIITCWDSEFNYRKIFYEQYKKRKIYAHKAYIKYIKSYFIPFVYKYLNKLGLTSIKVFGFESDDVIASFCKKYDKEHKITIMTTDNDLFQLINENVTVYLPTDLYARFRAITIKNCKKVARIEPKHVIPYKILAGCRSDNISGIPKIGETSAKEILEKHKIKKHKHKIKGNSKILKINKKLIKLPLKQLNVENKPSKINFHKFVDMCQIYGFKDFSINIKKVMESLSCKFC